MTKSFLLLTRRTFLGGALVAPGWACPAAAETPAAQPYFASLLKTMAALAECGEAVPSTLTERLANLRERGDVEGAEALIAPFVLLNVVIDRSGYGLPQPRGIAAATIEQGWRSFLIRVENPHASTDRFMISLDIPVLGAVESASADHFAHERQSMPTRAGALDTVARAKLAIDMFDDPPLDARLIGIPVEYRIAQLTSFVAGRFETGVMAGAFPAQQFVWAPAQKAKVVGFARSSRDVTLQIRDDDGTPCIASLVIRDRAGRLYPDKRGRLAPDMYFQDQVYRASGETVRLPDGEFQLLATRGPEYLAQSYDFTVAAGRPSPLVQLRRWIKPEQHGWYSGDVHVHASGCAHYNEPTVGVGPATMMRHAAGEGLDIAEVLTWGPGWEVQSRNFTGAAIDSTAGVDDPELAKAHGVAHSAPSTTGSVLRYDVEVSGFPSSQAGHLILLRLKDQRYPRTTGPRDWPSWTLPILKWAKAQGAVTGYAHSGLGLADISSPIPSRTVPSFDSIGANGYLVDVAHDVVDFLAGGDTIPAAELTLWYHALNCGFRTVLAGETDWPCMSDDGVGAGRTYVALQEKPQGDRGYEDWVTSLARGRCYMGDGRAHLVEMTVGSGRVGDTVYVQAGKRIRFRAIVAARLDPEVSPTLAGVRDRPSWLEPRWHLERARLPGTRKVPVELIVNGEVVAVRHFAADGRPNVIEHTLQLKRSSWVALRILPSLHTNPVFVEVDGKPVRASRESADWCLQSIDKLQAAQLPQIEERERAAAAEAYEYARARFTKIRAECSS